MIAGKMPRVRLLIVSFLFLDRLRQRFMANLVECGWRDDMKDVAINVIQEHGGLSQFTLDRLIEDLLPHGRSTVPPALREEIMEQLRQIVREQRRR